MRLNVNEEIAALRGMTVKQLRQRHIELFGEPTRSANRQWLFRRMAWRVQALAEGDLSDRARRRARALAGGRRGGRGGTNAAARGLKVRPPRA